MKDNFTNGFETALLLESITTSLEYYEKQILIHQKLLIATKENEYERDIEIYKTKRNHLWAAFHELGEEIPLEDFGKVFRDKKISL